MHSWDFSPSFLEIPFVQLSALIRLGPRLSKELLPVSTVSLDCHGAHLLKIHLESQSQPQPVLAGDFAHKLNPQTLTGSIKGKCMNHSRCSPLGDKLLWTWIVFRAWWPWFQLYPIMSQAGVGGYFSREWSYFSPFSSNMFVAKDHILESESSLSFKCTLQKFHQESVQKMCLVLFSCFWQPQPLNKYQSYQISTFDILPVDTDEK